MSYNKILAELDWKIGDLGQDFGPVRPDLLGFCLKILKFELIGEILLS